VQGASHIYISTALTVDLHCACIGIQAQFEKDSGSLYSGAPSSGSASGSVSGIEAFDLTSFGEVIH
jgi:hypothetical protein